MYDKIQELKKVTGLSIPNLLALAQKNDPFYAGSKAKRKHAEWFETIWGRHGFQTGVHLRRIHYRLVSEDDVKKVDGTPYTNTENCWEYLCAASKVARYLGLVSAGAFVDRRSPDPHIYRANGYESEEYKTWHVEDPIWTLPRIATDIEAEIDLSIPEPSVYGYGYSESDQPYHIELWVEKSTQDDVLIPLCRQMNVNLITSLGFQSITSVISFLSRVRKTEKPARIFYISDFDPGGRGMPMAVARQIEFWLEQYAPEADVKLECLALTGEQVRAYQLPRTPIKDNDLRKASFEERYGEGATELDALEALYPGELARIVGEAIMPYRDNSLESRLYATGDDAEDIANAKWETATSGHEAELSEIENEAKIIVARYQDQLEELSSALHTELEPLNERLEGIRQSIFAARENLVIDLPDRREAEIDDLDEADWLFDSDREYLDQLAVYKSFVDG